MTRSLARRSAFAVLALSLAAGGVGTVHAYPEPNKASLEWELKFQYDLPRRIVVESPGGGVPKAYWFMTYTVTNPTDREQSWLPVFEMMTKEGKVIRSDHALPGEVFDKVKARANKRLLEPAAKIAGPLLIGGDQARDGVAIWEEPMAEMGTFSIFIAGISGEATPLTDDAGKPVVSADSKPILLYKTKQLDFVVNGDEIQPDIDALDKTNERWVMR